MKLAKVFLSKFVALILLKIAPCRRKENRATLQARSVQSRGRDLESQISPRVGKNQSSGVKPRHFVKEGANARMRHGYREVLSISQAGSVPDNELSLKVSLPWESSSWANVRALSELPQSAEPLILMKWRLAGVLSVYLERLEWAIKQCFIKIISNMLLRNSEHVFVIV